MSLKLICSSVAILLLSLPACAISSGGYEIPKDVQTVQTIGRAKVSQLPTRFSLLNWNIEKAKQGEVWANDFVKLQSNYDLVLIQEAVSDEVFMKSLQEKKDTMWNYFVAWIRNENKSTSGLVMGSHVKPSTVSFSRTVDTESFIKTPKLTSYQTYKVKGLKNSELLVANIHAINFVSLEKFGRHIQQVMDRVDAHKGPVIFVGDMNTWNKKRVALLMEETKKRNLVWYDFERPEVKGMHSKLDHIFVRGLKVNEVKSLTSITSSDHYPISAEFEVL